MSTNFEYTGGIGAAQTGYLECAIWASCAEDGTPMDEGAAELAPETVADMRRECAEFCAAAGDLVADWNASQVGHDLWLTRNHHGAGFWDRGKSTGDALTAMAHACGERSLYTGDDGLIYQL